MTDTAQQPKEMTAEEMKKLQEVHIPVSWKGLKKAWKKIFYTAPFKFYQNVMLGIEKISRKMMVGYGSLLSMPIGIVLRNTSRAMYRSSEGRYLHTSQIIGVLGAIGAVGLVTLAAVPLFTGLIGTWAAYVAVGSVAALALSTPAYTLSTLISSTITGAAVATFSAILAAPVNLIVGFRRSQAAMKGVKLSEEQVHALEKSFDHNSPLAENEADRFYRASNIIAGLPASYQKDIYNNLKKRFDQSAQKEEANNKGTVTPDTAAEPTI